MMVLLPFRGAPAVSWCSCRFVVLLLLFAVSGCSRAVRPDSYTPADCHELRRETRRSGAFRVGSNAIALGLGAGGAVSQLVDSKEAAVTLALGAILAGALGLGAGHMADEAQKEWMDYCPHLPFPEATSVAPAPSP